jgi:hypothetical protein
MEKTHVCLRIDAIAKCSAELAAKYGAWFVLMAEVIHSLKQHQPVC